MTLLYGVYEYGPIQLPLHRLGIGPYLSNMGRKNDRKRR
jgi:hypothetical protein